MTNSDQNKIANVENVICSAETKAQHPVLYHYTKPKAFESIVSSQSLWCSHYKGMLDTDEIVLMRQLLPPAVAPLMNEIVEKKFNRKRRRLWAACGGGDQAARDLVNSLYAAAIGGKADYASLDPYLFSFSTHSADSEFDREHGVESQWKGYGADGYCFVFDISELAKMLLNEGNRRYWAWLMLEPVRYADKPVEQLFPELVSGLAGVLRQIIEGVKFPEAAVPEFLKGISLLKGTEYKAEREVRIVALPGTPQAAKYAMKEFPNEFVDAPTPEIKKDLVTGKQYVSLFEGSSDPLPIKRVIVGPGADQLSRAERARALLGDIPVTLSLCP
jgi:hypothetical protein